MRRLVLGIFVFLLVSISCSFAQIQPPFNQCPPVGADSGCAILLEIDSTGSLRVHTDPSQGPYDQIEDTLFGVQNNSQKTILSIPLKGASPIFSFDGDGICAINFFNGQPLFQPAPPGCPFGPTSYEGPGVSFSNISADFTSGTVNFAGGIPPGGSAYFSLELAIQTLCPALKNVPLLHQFAAPWNTDTYDHAFVTANFPDESTTAVLPGTTAELVVFPLTSSQPDGAGAISTTITVSQGSNNLDGLRDAINAAQTTVVASVGSKTVHGKTVFFLSLSSGGVNSVQLRTSVGGPASNILTNVGAKGCYLTSSVMIVNYHAQQQGNPFRTTPRDLNNFLNSDPGGYVGDLVNPNEVVRYARQHGINLSYNGRVNKRDDFTLDTYLCSGNPVMLNVLNKQHFVLATGQTEVDSSETYNINDPGFSNRTTLQPYSFTYQGLRLFSTSFTSPSALYVVAHSPVELLVTDPRGRRTGLDPNSNSSFQEIPDSSYGSDSILDDADPDSGDTTPEVKSFEMLLPNSGTYTVDVIGTGDGPYTLDFLGYDFLNQLQSTTLSGTAVPGVTARYLVQYSPFPGVPLTVTAAPAPDDTTPPVTTAAPNPQPNANGWNNSDVTVNFSATDNAGGSGVKEIHISLAGAQSGSSVVTGSSASVTVQAEGATTVSYFAVDNAGNQETPKTLVLNIDKTPPSVAGLPSAGCSLWPPDHKLVQVGTVSAVDALSGLVGFTVDGVSSEPPGQFAPDVVVTGSGLGARTVQIRAERLGSGTGRIYTISATASDLAGNMATSTATCVVPHDQGQP